MVGDRNECKLASIRRTLVIAMSADMHKAMLCFRMCSTNVRYVIAWRRRELIAILFDRRFDKTPIHAAGVRASI